MSLFFWAFGSCLFLGDPGGAPRYECRMKIRQGQTQAQAQDIQSLGNER